MSKEAELNKILINGIITTKPIFRFCKYRPADMFICPFCQESIDYDGGEYDIMNKINHNKECIYKIAIEELGIKI